jgi:uncharacterized membrane protein YphA (DoxX/SURF4 family)
MMHKFSLWLDHFIFEEYKLPKGAISLFRIVYTSFILFVVGVPQFRWIADKPDYFFSPPRFSLAIFFSGFPDYAFLFILDITLVILFVFLLFGLFTRVATILVGLLMIVGFSFYYSFGKINHDAHLMIFTPLVMCFSNWGRYFSLDSKRTDREEKREERHWPILLLAIIIGFAMFSAGVPKLLDGWLETSTQAVKGFVVTFHYYNTFPERFLQPHLISYDNVFFWEAMDFTAVFFEIGFLFAVIKQKWFRAFVVIAVLFHTMNILLFSISFSNNLALYLLFIKWDNLLQGFTKSRLRELINTKYLIYALVTITLSYIVDFPLNFYALGSTLSIHFLTSSLIVCILASLFFSINYFESTLISDKPALSK